MGLQERRVQEEFKKDDHVLLCQQINNAAGFDVEVEVDWDSLSEEGMSHIYKDSWTKLYYRTTIAALEAITVDDIGKATVKDHLKKIVFQNKSQNTLIKNSITFSDGVLTFDHRSTFNIPSPDHGENGDVLFQDFVQIIKKSLEEKM